MEQPARLILGDGSAVPLVFESWKQISGSTGEFYFSRNTSLRVVVNEEEKSLLFFASFPGTASALVFDYSPAGDYKISEQTQMRTVFSSRNDMFVLNVPLENPDSPAMRLVLYADSPGVSYRPVNPENALSFESVSSLEFASDGAYRATINAITDRLIAAYESAPQSVDEKATVAYMAAMASRNRLAQARARIPTSFVNTPGRTYLSAPYFGSLVQLNREFVAETAAMTVQLDTAIQEKNLDFFKTPGLGDFFIRESGLPQIPLFLQLPANVSGFEPTVLQAAAIIDVYSSLLLVRSEYAALLEPVISVCIKTIENSASLEAGRLVLSDEAGAFDILQTVTIGAALINYSDAVQSAVYTNAGQMVISSVCSGHESEFGLMLLGELYPLISRHNPFYPRLVFIASLPSGPLCAWTVASLISYQTDTGQNITLTIDYPLGEINYIIFSHMSAFRSIEIYNIPFRTDPRFESYNSSGYVYDEETRSLLLKSLHRSRLETIRLWY
ncbi:MAG: hypothetical protein LBS97_00310 [Treponema sp.]|nr:hypothetical protein [Treponema sp.]